MPPKEALESYATPQASGGVGHAINVLFCLEAARQTPGPKFGHGDKEWVACI
jgi:hypothetical protein